jgi:hypothetical protein
LYSKLIRIESTIREKDLILKKDRYVKIISGIPELIFGCNFLPIDKDVDKMMISQKPDF